MSWHRGCGGRRISLLSVVCSICFVIAPRTPAQEWPFVGGALPHWSLIKKMPNKLAYSPIVQGLSQLRVSPSGWPWLVSGWQPSQLCMLLPSNVRSNKWGSDSVGLHSPSLNCFLCPASSLELRVGGLNFVFYPLHSVTSDFLKVPDAQVALNNYIITH